MSPSLAIRVRVCDYESEFSVGPKANLLHMAALYFGSIAGSEDGEGADTDKRTWKP